MVVVPENDGLVVSALTVGLGTCCEPPSGLDRWVVDVVHLEPVVRRYSGRQPSSCSNCNIAGNAVDHAVEEEISLFGEGECLGVARYVRGRFVALFSNFVFGVVESSTPVNVVLVPFG